MSQLFLDAVSKTYARGQAPAVTQVSLSVEQGELLALVGESGSGKTTLLRLITGLETLDAGTITLAGKQLSAAGRHLPPEDRGIGLVFQHHALFPHLTVEKNVTFGLRHWPAARRKDALESLLSLVGLQGFAKRYPHELSGGERQRIALARALAPEPKLLLLDEPFSSLDPQWRQAIRDETRDILKKRQATAILVTHHTLDALSVADRIAVLHQGKLQQTGTPREIYYAPVSALVASLFGICNFLPLGRLQHPDGQGRTSQIGPPQADGTGVWYRPEDLELQVGREASCGASLMGGVIHVVFQGDHHDVTLRCFTKAHQEAFTVRVQHRGDKPVSIGQQWEISARARL